jgi:hypothetical protein
MGEVVDLNSLCSRLDRVEIEINVSDMILSLVHAAALGLMEHFDGANLKYPSWNESHLRITAVPTLMGPAAVILGEEHGHLDVILNNTDQGYRFSLQAQSHQYEYTHLPQNADLLIILHGVVITKLTPSDPTDTYIKSLDKITVQIKHEGDSYYSLEFNTGEESQHSMN